MAEDKKTYSIIDDTATGKVEESELAKSIQASAIVTALERIDSSGDVLEVIFKDTLSVGDKTILDGLVLNTATEPAFSLPSVRIQKASSSGLHTFFHGFTFNGTKATSVSGDFTLPEDRELEGCTLHVYNHAAGDTCDILVVQPTNPEVILAELACDIPIPPSGEFPEFAADSTKPLPAGLKIRITYNSIAGATVDATVGTTFRFQRANLVT